MKKNIGNAEVYESEFVEEQEMVTTSKKGIGGLVKKHWKKAAIGIGMFALGVVAGKKLGNGKVEYADVVEGKFVETIEE